MTRCAVLYTFTSSLLKIPFIRASIRRRDRRQNVSARSVAVSALARSSGDLLVFIAWACEHVALIANSSAPISTIRARTAWRFSSLGPNRTMEWNSFRASRRDARLT